MGGFFSSFFLANKVKRINSGPERSVIKRSMMSVPISVIRVGNVHINQKEKEKKRKSQSI